MSKITKSTARHGHIHFGGHHPTASVNVEHTYSGGNSNGLPTANDIDVDVPPGGALERSINETAKLLAAAAAKKLGHPVTVIDKKKPAASAPAKRASKRTRSAIASDVEG